jgi:hypothetical protein
VTVAATPGERAEGQDIAHAGAESPSAPAPTPRHLIEACPLCGAPLDPEQDWCLNCGAAARTRLAATPNWRAPAATVAVIAVLALGVLAAALVKLAGGSGSSTAPPVTTTVTTPAAAPTTATTPAAPGATSTAPGAAPTGPAAATTTPGATATPGATGSTSVTTTPGGTSATTITPAQRRALTQATSPLSGK